MKATIDRIEGAIAVLVSCDDESMRLTIPVSLLPLRHREGDTLIVRIERDGTATESAKERVSGLIEKLKKRK